MAAPNGRIEPGQPLESAISARAWNRAQDAADIVLGAGVGLSAGGPRMAAAPFVALPCKNISGSDVPRFGVLAINGFDTLAIAPTSTASDAATLQFQSQPVLFGKAPTDANSTPAIAIQPIKNGSTAAVAVAGVVQCQIEIVSSEHWLAVTKEGACNEMKTSAYAGYPIIWKQSGTGSGKWALISLGNMRVEPSIRLGKISANWNKGDTATVTRYTGAGVEFQSSDPLRTFGAVNKFANVTATSSAKKWVACALVDSTWHLVAAEC